ncbi:MAG TPA: hypothetical protein ENN43_07020 [bacterium]|nr:hypothetical protein [bacterium]
MARNLDFKLRFASLLPEFIHQFLISPGIEQDSITCLELEDLKDALQGCGEPELEGIMRLLDAEREKEAVVEPPEDMTNEEKKARLEKMSEKLDAELEAVDDVLYHAYTPAELKYIFEQIIDNAELIYSIYRRHADISPALAINFSFKNGIEAGFVIEFQRLPETPAPPEECFLLPILNNMVTDDITACAYFLSEPEEEEEAYAALTDVIGVLNLKENKSS